MKTFVTKSGPSTLVGALLLGFVSGCGGGPQPAPVSNTPMSEVDEWWNNPGFIQDHLAAIGVSPLLNARAEGPARTYAETDGRGKLAAVLKARMTQLVENWSKDVADLNKEASFSSYINNEAMTRQLVDATVKGAVPYRYKNTGTNVYVLMVLKDPSQWTKNLVDTVEEQALKDETLFKTEVMKNDFRNRMDKLRTEETEKVQTQQQNFMKALGGSQGAAPTGVSG